MTNFLRRRSSTSTRNRVRAPRFVIVEPTNHWRIVDGEHYRDCLVLDRARGERRVIGVRDDLVQVAA